MEYSNVIGKSQILQSELDKQVSEILDVLKSKKQTYAVDKFVLEKTIDALQEIII